MEDMKNMSFPCDLEIPLLDKHSRQKTHVHADVCTNMLTAALVTIAKRQKKFRWFTTDEQLFIHREEVILICATAFLDIKTLCTM